MGSPTLRARTSPPRMCATTSKYTQATPWVEGRKKSKDTLQRTRKRWRGVWSLDTSGRRRWTVFATCVLWILMPPTASPKTPISAWKLLRSIRRISTLTPASNSAGTLLPSSPQWTAFLGSRRRQHLKVFPAASQQSGRNPTHLPAGMWRVGLRYLLSGKRTTTSWGAGFRPPKSSWNTPSGRTARAYTPLGKIGSRLALVSLCIPRFFPPSVLKRKSEQDVKKFLTYLIPVHPGHVLIIQGGRGVSTPPPPPPGGLYRIELTLFKYFVGFINKYKFIYLFIIIKSLQHRIVHDEVIYLPKQNRRFHGDIIYLIKLKMFSQ